MSGYIKDENSLANGIPNRTISPETGSFGNATKTNKGDTSEGTNQEHQARPAPAAGLEGAHIEIDDKDELVGEERSFRSGDIGSADLNRADNDLESPAQQIADGGDHFKHGKRFSDDDKHERKEALRSDDRDGLDDGTLGTSLSDDRFGR